MTAATSHLFVARLSRAIVRDRKPASERREKILTKRHVVQAEDLQPERVDDEHHRRLELEKIPVGDHPLVDRESLPHEVVLIEAELGAEESLPDDAVEGDDDSDRHHVEEASQRVQ